MISVKKLTVASLIIVCALTLSACKKATETTQDTQKSTNTTTEQSTGTVAAEVKASGAAFDPSTVTIKAGDSITWVNDSDKEVQVGSADHPTHTKNPSLTGGQFVISLNPGESKTVSAGSNVGEWGYHDHLNPSAFGRVIIE